MYNPQHKLTEYLKSKGIVPQAYSPLGSTDAPLLTDGNVVEISQKHGLSSADVLIGYLGTLAVDPHAESHRLLQFARDSSCYQSP